jgi:hypothetical protein
MVLLLVETSVEQHRPNKDQKFVEKFKIHIRLRRLEFELTCKKSIDPSRYI